MEIFGIWLAAFLTLSIYSFLYRDNPFYRFAEYLFIGISVGYYIVIYIHQGFIPFAWEPFWAAVKPFWPGIPREAGWIGLIKLIPIALGLLFFGGLSPRHTWLIRYPSAVLVGFGSGISIPLMLQTFIFAQTRGTVEPFAAINAGTLSPWGIIEAVLMLIGVTCTLTYFFFSVEHRGPDQLAFKSRYCLPHDWVRCGIREHRYGTCRAPHSTRRFSAKRLDWYDNRLARHNFLTLSRRLTARKIKNETRI